MVGHLSYVMCQNCGPTDAPCPSAYVERFSFEMDKRYHETKLQVLLSPIILITTDMFLVSVLITVHKLLPDMT
jgi:hypothetical protein